VKVARQMYQISLEVGHTEAIEVDRGARLHGRSQKFWARHVLIEYEKEFDRPWKWTMVSVFGDELSHHWKPGDSLITNWAVGLIYQYYPQGPDKKERS
jgi:hypothetical protein